jgi:hypothetical protein
MNTRSFSDETEPPRPTIRNQVRSHFLPVGIGLSILGLALGMHLAVKAVVAVAFGHLVLILAIGGLPALRRHLRGEQSGEQK